MNVAMQAGNFLLSVWLWNMTWGFYHIPFTIVIMTLCFKYCARIRILKAFTYALCAQVTTAVLYSLFVVGVLIYGLGFEYTPGVPAFSKVVACVSLALVYTAIQWLLFYILSWWQKYSLRKVMLAILVGNILGALFTAAVLK